MSVFIVFRQYKSLPGQFPRNESNIDSVFKTSDEADMCALQKQQQIKDLHDPFTSYYVERWNISKFQTKK